MNTNTYETLNENNIFIKMQVSGLNISLNNLVSLLKSDFIERYNPFEKYFNDLPEWDGKDYIQHLAGFVKTKDRARFDKHFKKWLVRAVSCALVDDYFNKQAFILVHEKQNSGKSTFCRFLCPPVLGDYIAENISTDKDSRIVITRNLLVNLDELATLSKIEINGLKSLFSKEKINDRLPYDRRNSIIPRRCSFIGSTNQMEFLNDETGSVRWLCFEIDEIDWAYKQQVDINRVWAQAYHLFRTGWDCNLTAAEIEENEVVNKRFQMSNPERDLLMSHFKPSDEHRGRFMTATEILNEVQIKTMARLSSRVLGKELKYLNFRRVMRYNKKKGFSIYGYYVEKTEEPNEENDDSPS